MQANEALINTIVVRVLEELNDVDKTMLQPEKGIFSAMDECITAARSAYLKLKTMSVEQRERIISAIRQMAYDNAGLLAEMAVHETGMGKIADKMIKNRLVAQKTPGTEDLTTQAWTGDRGLTIVEMAPYGVIGAITPTTNPSETLLCNSIGMIAAGNSVVFSPHPSAKKTSAKTVMLINEAVAGAGGPRNLVCAMAEPSIEAATEMMEHPNINMLVATGGPGVVKAVLSSGKKAIGAGAGNPPVIVDETADISKAARDIVAGCSFDNNLPCIAEKEAIVIGRVADELISYMRKYGAFLIKGRDIEELVKLVLSKTEAGGYAVNKSYVGKDAQYILKQIGIDVADDVKVILCEVEEGHPLVLEELMMPILPLVQVKNIDAAIELAVKVEHGNRHTAMIHSKNVDNMTRFARAVQTTIFVKNGPSYAGIGVGGEGFTTFTIAGPTGEGLTSARTFTRQRRCVLVDAFSII